MTELGGGVALPPNPDAASTGVAETAGATPAKTLSHMIFGLIPRKLGSPHFSFQIMLLGPASDERIRGTGSGQARLRMAV